MVSISDQPNSVNVANVEESAQTPIRFVEVTFTGSKVNQIVPLGDVFKTKNCKTHIQPSHVGDYVVNQSYAVKWFHCRNDGLRCSEDHRHQYRLLPAVIHRMGGTPQDIQEEVGTGPRQRFKPRASTNQESETYSPTPKEIRKEMLENKKVRNSVLQKRSYETMKDAMNIIPSKIAKKFQDSDSSEEDSSSTRSAGHSPLSEPINDARNSPDRHSAPPEIPVSLRRDLRPCSVRLSIMDPTPEIAASPVDHNIAELPVGASQSNTSTSQDAEGGNSSGHIDLIDPTETSSQSIFEDAMRESAEAQARLDSQREAEEAARLRMQVAAEEEEARRLRNQAEAEENRLHAVAQADAHRLRLAETQRTTAQEEADRLQANRARRGSVAGQQITDEAQRALLAAAAQKRLAIDGYSRPERLDRRGKVKRDPRSRRELALSVYELYHKEGGPYYADRVRYRYKIEGQKIYLTRDKSVDIVRWGLINKKNARTFIASTATILFTHQELLISALDPTQIKNIVPGQPRPRKIDRERLLLLMSLYHDYVFGGNIPDLKDRETQLMKGCEYLSKFLYDFREKEIQRLEEQEDGEELEQQ